MDRSSAPIIFDRSDGQELRINMIGSWLRRSFGQKIVKLSLDGGFTCPNRDGSKGVGGCLFCSDSGSGDMASSLQADGGTGFHQADSSPVDLQSIDTSSSLQADGGTGFHQADSSPINLQSIDKSSSLQAGAESAPGCDSSSAAGSISSALGEQVRLLSNKWPQAGYIAYFQSHTNTYAPAEYLRALFEAALDQPRIMGLAIATRSDCITDEALELLTELNQKTFLWVELGLQTIHSKTALAMNLCHTLSDYDDALRRLSARGIRTVTHLILGLPGETPEMMLDSVRYLCRPLSNSLSPDRSRPVFPDHTAGQSHPSPVPGDTDHTAGKLCPSPVPGDADHIFGLKLHMLNVVKGSGMAAVYPDYVPFESIDEYTDLVLRAMELIPPDITIHRISGDAPRSTLIAPEWSYRKRTILNEIHRKMRERNTWQGRLAD